MKKIIALLLAGCMIFGFAACSGNKEVVACTGCGTENKSEALFCNSCGAELSAAAQGETQSTLEETGNSEVDAEAAVSITSAVTTTAHEHSFSKATCTEPGRCDCGATDGAAKGHNYSPATCVSPSTCKNCGDTIPGLADHNWKDATCVSPRSCSVCGETDGSTASHNFGTSGICETCDKRIFTISLQVPTRGGLNGYASLVITNNSDSAISVPSMVGINGKLCTNQLNRDTVLAPGTSKKITYYRSILPSENFDKKHYDMYLDDFSTGYIVIDWEGNQYYAEYGVNGLTVFYRGNVNGPA